MTDDHYGSIDAEVLTGEEMEPVNVPWSYRTDQARMLAEISAYLKAKREIEQATELGVIHMTAHSDEEVVRQHSDVGRQNLKLLGHWPLRAVAWVHFDRVMVDSPGNYDAPHLEYYSET